MDLLLRVALVASVLLLSFLVGAWWQRRNGRVQEAAAATNGRRPVGFTRGQLVEVGLEGSGAQALGLLLGSPTCAPCVQVKATLAEIEAERDAFRWAYIDAGDHLDLAKEHHVMRVPTLFLIDPNDGRIIARTSGVPAKRDLVAALDR